MLFIDLDKLKIIKDYHYETANGNIEFDFMNNPLSYKTNEIIAFFQSLIRTSPLAISYEVTIDGDGEANAEEVDSFLSAVNYMTMIFFANFIKDEGRNREHRLDVPEKLKVIKTSRLTLKKAINQKTVNDVFNLTIYYKDLIYKLCDEKEMKGESDD